MSGTDHIGEETVEGFLERITGVSVPDPSAEVNDPLGGMEEADTAGIDEPSFTRGTNPGDLDEKFAHHV